MICKVRKTISDHAMIAKGSKVCVAVSGGADSMALLNVLNTLQTELDITLCAAHVNHGIRGDEANRDEAFVTAQCKLLQIPLIKIALDVPGVSAKTGEGLEECGRRLRYEFFQSLDADYIATAHNLDDRIETFVFNFVRGSGVKGLCSIPYVRGSIIRPLLDCSRSEIESYCAGNGISYVHDSTNDDTAYSRNRIRHHVLPEFAALNPSFDEAALRCFDSLCVDESYMNEKANELLQTAEKSDGYDVGILQSSHRAVLSRTVRAIVLKETGIQPNHREIEDVIRILSDSGQVQLSGGRFARVRKGLLDFPDIEAATSFAYPLHSGFNDFDGFSVSLDVFERNNDKNFQNVNIKSNIYMLDCDKIVGKLCIRNRRDGDSVRFARRGCTKTLRKLFNEAAVPPEKRDDILIVSDEAGLLLVEGFGVCERAAVCENTERILKISLGRK